MLGPVSSSSPKAGDGWGGESMVNCYRWGVMEEKEDGRKWVLVLGPLALGFSK